MESSPPTRAWERPGSPTNESQWSLDLNALDPHSGTSTPLPKQHVDRIFSEDIDGPSDFTENMEAWIRGGTGRTPARGTLNGTTRGTIKGARPELGSVFEQPEGQQEDSGQEEGVDDARTEHGELPDDGEARSASHHTPAHSPQRSHDQDEHLKDEQPPQEHDEASSDWDPYQNNSTPQPPAHKQFLQPTVEDYHSELTPARPLSHKQQSPPQEPASDPHQDQQEDKSFTSEQDTEGRPSSPTLSPVRSPVTQRAVSRNTPPTEDLNLLHQLQELQAKCQQLEHLNAALGDALSKERQQRQDDHAAHERELDEADRREKDLNEMKEAAFRDKDGFRKEFSAMQQKLLAYEAGSDATISELKQQIGGLQRQQDGLYEEVESERTEHEQELRALEQDLELARRGREDAEEAAKVHQEEAKELRESHQADMARLESQLQQAEMARQGATEQLKASTRERDVARADAYEKAQALSSLQAELETLKQSHEDNTKRIENEHIRAVEVASALQTQLKQLRQQLTDEQTAHDAETKGQQDKHRDAILATSAESEGLRNELEAAQSRLNSMVIDRDSTQDELTEAHAEIASLKQQLTDLRADNVEVNAALDARISESIRKRESHWQLKLAEERADWEKERQLMARSLLRQWGREEVGAMQPEQGYEYKFVLKGSPAKAGA